MLVRVDMLSQFVVSYVVEVEDDDPPEYAMDTVVMDEHTNELAEFSQRHIGYTALGCRAVELDEVIKQCRDENGGLNNWSDEKIVECYINYEKK